MATTTATFQTYLFACPSRKPENVNTLGLYGSAVSVSYLAAWNISRCGISLPCISKPSIARDFHRPIACSGRSSHGSGLHGKTPWRLCNSVPSSYGCTSAFATFGGN